MKESVGRCPQKAQLSMLWVTWVRIALCQHRDWGVVCGCTGKALIGRAAELIRSPVEEVHSVMNGDKLAIKIGEKTITEKAFM